MKIVIVGGVAGGASAAARARRLDESAEIVLIERGSAPSFANCGMPYYIGGEIADRSKLLVTPVARLQSRYRLDVRPRSQVERIDRAAKQVTVRNLASGEVYDEAYDRLILSPGAAPYRPALPGVDLPGIFTLRNLDDADRLREATLHARLAVILGGGFIGLEMAENLVHRGLKVTLIERNGQLLTPWDAEMIAPLQSLLTEQGVDVRLGQSATSFHQTDGGLQVALANGEQLSADFVVLAIGVRPESSLAVAAGLAVGERGGIQVDTSMRTSDPDIYAVGDAIETFDPVSGEAMQIPLAGPANRQGRIAADHIFGRITAYRGTQGTAIVGLFGKTAAMTGLSEKACMRLQRPYEKVYLHAGHHAGYYPGAEQLSLKLLFDPQNGRILGAQAVGGTGVDKRIDVIATAMQGGLSVFDLEEAELCYAPQFGSAKDPVNMAGFIAAGVVRGDQPVRHSDALLTGRLGDVTLIDVRTPAEHTQGAIPGALNIDIDQLRQRLAEIPRDKPVVAYCQVGFRGYLATRILLQADFDAANLSGGYTTYSRRVAAGAA
jgi:NADPH-dependent 2,4-dienoyl-CoA reductase/sulfur reductase-like enzyme/rhodanese-related sulfurtransferase